MLSVIHPSLPWQYVSCGTSIFLCRARWHARTPALPSAFMTLPADKRHLLLKCSQNVNQRSKGRREVRLYCRKNEYHPNEIRAQWDTFSLWRCSLFPGESLDTEENWCSQVNRLQQLLDKLECQVGRSSTAPAECICTQRQQDGGGVC